MGGDRSGLERAEGRGGGGLRYPRRRRRPGPSRPFAALNVDLAADPSAWSPPAEDYEISVTGRLAEEVSYELTGDTPYTSSPAGERGWSSSPPAMRPWVMVTVPEGAYLESADLNADMGQVEVDGITAAALQVSSGLGNVDLSDVTAGDASLTLSMGDLTAYGPHHPEVP